nr:Rieske 2Fe-2S domain-containing protein [Oceanospirillaceae bacterium]
IADVPVLVVRQVDGGIDAFVNACAHRFACLMPEQQGCVKRFVCRYHAWSYNLDGSLSKAPHMHMKPDFEPSQYGLRPLHTEVWQGFIYVTLAATADKSVAERLAPLTEQVVGRYDMACYKTILRETMVWDANWKNLIENFTESYHVPVAHKKTFAQHKKPLSSYVIGEDYDYFGYHRAPKTAGTGSGAAHPNNHRLDGEWRRMMVDCCVFPSHLITLMPDYLWYISVQPLGTGQMRATWGVAIAPENLADVSAEKYEAWVAENKRYIDVANSEDKVLVEALHRGSLSPLLPKGVLHPLERNLWQFTRYLARITQSHKD